jgi:hypothetical protein
MALVLLVLALIPSTCLIAAMVIRAWEPRSAWGAPREKGKWSLSFGSDLHGKSKYTK